MISPDKSEIWIYYNGNTDGSYAAGVFRTRLSLDGHTWLGTDLIPGLNLINVDVSYANGRFYMTGNATLQDASLFVSADGKTWRPFDGANGILITSPSDIDILTPHLHYSGQDGSLPKFDFFFGWGLVPAAPSAGTPPPTPSNYIMHWTFDLTTVVPISTATPTPTPVDNSQNMYIAGQAFVNAYASLQAEKQKGTTLPALQPWIDVCNAARTNAANWGVSVSQWTCQ